MKKSVIRWDKERQKWRVDTGIRLNQYVVRTESLERAKAISEWVARGYEIGYKDGWSKGFDKGFDDGYEFAALQMKTTAEAMMKA